jgi:hypothetical protein
MFVVGAAGERQKSAHVRRLGGETAAPETGHSFSFLGLKLDQIRLGSLFEPTPPGAYPEPVFASFKAFAGQTRILKIQKT